MRGFKFILLAVVFTFFSIYVNAQEENVSNSIKLNFGVSEPLIKWLSPNKDGVVVQKRNLTLNTDLEHNSKLKNYKIYLNGELIDNPTRGFRVTKKDESESKIIEVIELNNGLNQITIEVEDETGEVFTFKRNLTFNSEKVSVGAPSMRWVLPKNRVEKTLVSPYNLSLCVTSKSLINGVTIYINGEVKSKIPSYLQPSEDGCDYLLQHQLPLSDGINNIKVEVENSEGKGESEIIQVHYKQERRIALVIGNAEYQNVGLLKNPVNDAKAIAKILKASDFEVLEYYDLSWTDMWKALSNFNKKILGENEKGVALFYYAGHGLQYEGSNYLVPVNADIEKAIEIKNKTVGVNQIIDYMETVNNRLSIMILDACRNNPFRSIMMSDSRSVYLGSGLAQPQAATGTYIAYATAPGSVASDGGGKNGLYTQELLKAMSIPGLKIEDVFKRVRKNVLRLSAGQQSPWDSSNITGDFYFKR